MANWVTLANGVHIDLDDPNNPVTGSGSFSNLGNGNKTSKENSFSYKDTMARREKLTEIIASSKNKDEVKKAITEFNNINKDLQARGYAKNVNGAFVLTDKVSSNKIDIGNGKSYKSGDEVHVAVNGQRGWMTIDKITDETVEMHGYGVPYQKMSIKEFETYAKKGYITKSKN